MGAIEEHYKVKMSQQANISNKNEELDQKISQLNGLIEELSDQLEQEKMQNTILKENLRQENDQKKGKMVVENKQIEDMEELIRNLREKKEGLETEVSSSKVGMRLKNEEISDIHKKMKNLVSELEEGSTIKMKLERDKSTLKKAYTQLKMKYIDLKKSIKNSESCQNDSGNSHHRSDSLSKEQSDADDASDRNEESLNKEIMSLKNEIGRNILEISGLKNTLLEKETFYGQRVEQMGKELNDKDSEVQELGFETKTLQKLVQDLKSKRERALEEIRLLQTANMASKTKVSTNQEDLNIGGVLETEMEPDTSDSTPKNCPKAPFTYNINPQKLTKFLKEIYSIAKLIYINFLGYTSSKEDTLMIETEKSINQIIQQVSEFQEYSEIKLEYLRKKGLLPT